MKIILISDFAALLYSLNSHNLVVTFKNLNINETTFTFYSILNTSINIFVPKFTRKRSKFPHSYSKKLKLLIISKNVAYNSLKRQTILFITK